MDNNPELFDDSVMNENILSEGNRIGELAQQFFGADVIIPYSKDKSSMIMETEEAMKQKNTVIAEASFL